MTLRNGQRQKTQNKQLELAFMTEGGVKPHARLMKGPNRSRRVMTLKARQEMTF